MTIIRTLQAAKQCARLRELAIADVGPSIAHRILDEEKVQISLSTCRNAYHAIREEEGLDRSSRTRYLKDDAAPTVAESATAPPKPEVVGLVSVLEKMRQEIEARPITIDDGGGLHRRPVADRRAEEAKARFSFRDAVKKFWWWKGEEEQSVRASDANLPPGVTRDDRTPEGGSSPWKIRTGPPPTDGECIAVVGFSEHPPAIPEAITNAIVEPIEPPPAIIRPNTEHEVWIVLPDLHVPFHSVELLKKVCQFIIDTQPHGVVISGDYLDLHSLSRYAADSVYSLRDVTLSGEYEAGREVLGWIEAALPKGARREFLFGNHEDRYWRELEKGDRGKYGLALQSPTSALRLRELGWNVGENWTQDSVRLGEHLEVIHGIYCPVHAAKKHLDEFQGSVMMGHTHRFQSYVSGKRAAYNIGTLGDLNSRGFAYMPRTKRMTWVNGFAVVHIDERGDYWAHPVQCYDGRFIANGKVY